MGGSSAGEQWPVVKQAHQTLRRTLEIGFTLEPARNLHGVLHTKATFYTDNDNTENYHSNSSVACLLSHIFELSFEERYKNDM